LRLISFNAEAAEAGFTSGVFMAPGAYFKAVVQNISDEDGDGLFSSGFEAAEKSKVRTARLRRA
jgi:hypothetical protein